ncbi:MAG: orotidine-5'-phosphate decarboxylase [Rhodobiaceae bacterium]|nr:orotidine-5'-phosphate decarboxylase [Rhodobiaceae bacterium]RPF98136.1 MAG: orotidine-5'-phosphate decarboxylase [Rhizobiales bacterium TMED227]|tara:strand:- start:615 stop:1289 length:675 start_codon:yes stop_codon:yes gene_type:complete
MKDTDQAVSLINQIKENIDGIKIGMEAFYAMGHNGYLRLYDLGLPIFLDLKLHDIPNTVSSAIKSLLPLNPFIINIHTTGGSEMMRAAVEAISDNGINKPKLIGVTILTSMNEDSFNEQGISIKVEQQVINLSNLAKKCGLDGVVCSPLEAKNVKITCGEDFLTIVPGIRPNNSASNDQKRILTPSEAIKNGADILIVGRPITQAKDPNQAARSIKESIIPYEH